MGQRHTRSVADNMLLDFGYQFLSSQSNFCRCWSAGNRIGVLRDLGSTPPIEQSKLRTRVLRSKPTTYAPYFYEIVTAARASDNCQSVFDAALQNVR